MKINLKKEFFMISKYAFSVIVTFLAFRTAKKGEILVGGLLEILLIFVMTNLFYDDKSKPRKMVSYFVSSFLLLLYNLQMLVLYFSGSFVSMIMLTNLSSLRDISSNFVVYGFAIVTLLLFSFLPVCKVELEKRRSNVLLLTVSVFNIVMISCFGWSNNTIISLLSLTQQAANYNRLQNTVDLNIEEYGDSSSEFFNNEIDDYKTKPADLTEKPNVIVIFTEGLSKSIVDDPRGVTPNLQKLSKESISFENYYSHTFATYRGLIGQLYSGHQLNNNDSNNLISLQSIFSAYGYNTAFINTEPDNSEFTEYLKSFGFDRLITDESAATASEKTISDKDAYNLLYNTCLEMEKEDKPFFTAIYTFGTHATLNSPDEIYGEGKDAELNKFYNMDYQFGVFLDRFKNCELADNTLLIFTTDHCTYADQAFKTAFPKTERYHSDVGDMVMLYYYVGIEPDIIDVNGRNSINFAPTLLDYLDISSPNFFLGSSLFGGFEDNLFAYTFYDPFLVVTTKYGELSKLSDKEKEEFVQKVTRYFTASKKMRVDFVPMPTEKDAEIIDDGTYFTDDSIDSFNNSYYTGYYYTTPSVYNENTVTEPVSNTPQQETEPVQNDVTDPPADNGSTEIVPTDQGDTSGNVDSGDTGEPVGDLSDFGNTDSDIGGE